MARDGGGTYSLPAGLPSNGDTSDVGDIITPLQDIETDLNTDRPVVAGGTGASTAKGARTNLLFTKGNDIASAGALALGADGNYFDVTGTTAITSIGAWNTGDIAILQFDAALTLTHHASNLILPGGANITTAAGDHAAFEEYASGQWRCIWYTDASVNPTDLATVTYVDAQGLAAGTASTTTGGTAIDFTSLPAGLNRVELTYVLSTTGSSDLVVQLGTSGTPVTTNYVSTVSQGTNDQTETAGFRLRRATAAADTSTGSMVLRRVNGNMWQSTGTCGTVGGGSAQNIQTGHILAADLGGVLDMIRLTTVGGVNTFDVNSGVNILYE